MYAEGAVPSGPLVPGAFAVNAKLPVQMYAAGQQEVRMDWTSVEEGLPNDGEECVVVGMKVDGSIVQLIGYRANGNWVMEDEEAAAGGLKVRRWTPLAATRRAG